MCVFQTVDKANDFVGSFFTYMRYALISQYGENISHEIKSAIYFEYKIGRVIH